MAEKSLDNVTVVIIAFKNFRKSLKQELVKYQEELRKQVDGDSIPALATQIED